MSKNKDIETLLLSSDEEGDDDLEEEMEEEDHYAKDVYVACEFLPIPIPEDTLVLTTSRLRSKTLALSSSPSFDSSNNLLSSSSTTSVSKEVTKETPSKAEKADLDLIFSPSSHNSTYTKRKQQGVSTIPSSPLKKSDPTSPSTPTKKLVTEIQRICWLDGERKRFPCFVDVPLIKGHWKRDRRKSDKSETSIISIDESSSGKGVVPEPSSILSLPPSFGSRVRKTKLDPNREFDDELSSESVEPLPEPSPLILGLGEDQDEDECDPGQTLIDLMEVFEFLKTFGQTALGLPADIGTFDEYHFAVYYPGPTEVMNAILLSLVYLIRSTLVIEDGSEVVRPPLSSSTSSVSTNTTTTTTVLVTSASSKTTNGIMHPSPALPSSLLDASSSPSLSSTPSGRSRLKNRPLGYDSSLDSGFLPGTDTPQEVQMLDSMTCPEMLRCLLEDATVQESLFLGEEYDGEVGVVTARLAFVDYWQLPINIKAALLRILVRKALDTTTVRDELTERATREQKEKGERRRKRLEDKWLMEREKEVKGKEAEILKGMRSEYQEKEKQKSKRKEREEAGTTQFKQQVTVAQEEEEHLPLLRVLDLGRTRDLNRYCLLAGYVLIQECSDGSIKGYYKSVEQLDQLLRHAKSAGCFRLANNIMKWYTILKTSLVGPHHRTYFSEEEANPAPLPVVQEDGTSSFLSSSTTTSSSTSSSISSSISSFSTSLTPTTPTRTRGVVEKKRLPTFISYPELTIPAALGGSAPFKWPSPYPSEEVECPLCGAADHEKIDFFISEKDEGRKKGDSHSSVLLSFSSSFLLPSFLRFSSSQTALCSFFSPSEEQNVVREFTRHILDCIKVQQEPTDDDCLYMAQPDWAYRIGVFLAESCRRIPRVFLKPHFLKRRRTWEKKAKTRNHVVSVVKSLLEFEQGLRPMILDAAWRGDVEVDEQEKTQQGLEEKKNVNLNSIRLEWRRQVLQSKTWSQIALHVRFFDAYIRWNAIKLSSPRSKIPKSGPVVDIVAGEEGEFVVEKVIDKRLVPIAPSPNPILMELAPTSSSLLTSSSSLILTSSESSTSTELSIIISSSTSSSTSSSSSSTSTSDSILSEAMDPTIPSSSLSKKLPVPPGEEDEETDDDSEAVAEAEKFKVQYLLKWAGFPESESTWENEEDVYCLQLIREYEELVAPQRAREGEAAKKREAREAEEKKKREEKDARRKEKARIYSEERKKKLQIEKEKLAARRIKDKQRREELKRKRAEEKSKLAGEEESTPEARGKKKKNRSDDVDVSLLITAPRRSSISASKQSTEEVTTNGTEQEPVAIAPSSSSSSSSSPPPALLSTVRRRRTSGSEGNRKRARSGGRGERRNTKRISSELEPSEMIEVDETTPPLEEEEESKAEIGEQVPMELEEGEVKSVRKKRKKGRLTLRKRHRSIPSTTPSPKSPKTPSCTSSFTPPPSKATRALSSPSPSSRIILPSTPSRIASSPSTSSSSSSSSSSPSVGPTQQRRQITELRANLKKCLEALIGNIHSGPFRVPVPKSEPGYYETVKEPIDLSTMKRKLIKESAYESVADFWKDLELMHRNATLYCRAKDLLYIPQSSQKLLEFCKVKFQELGLVDKEELVTNGEDRILGSSSGKT